MRLFRRFGKTECQAPELVCGHVLPPTTLLRRLTARLSCKDVTTRKTRMAALSSFSLWILIKALPWVWYAGSASNQHPIPQKENSDEIRKHFRCILCRRRTARKNYVFGGSIDPFEKARSKSSLQGKVGSWRLRSGSCTSTMPGMSQMKRRTELAVRKKIR
jgi:hypothetical protein